MCYMFYKVYKLLSFITVYYSSWFISALATPLTRGSSSAPGLRWGLHTQTPVICSCYRARHVP